MTFLGIWILVLFAAGQLDGIRANKMNANTVLNYINSKRRLHGCPPLILSDDLSLNCTKHAANLAVFSRVILPKPIDNAYTENICKFNIEADALRLCVEEWYDGVRFNMLDEQAGEFTAMIWRSSKFMGYGEDIFGKDTIMVVRFYPGGNVLGQYTFNVPPVLEKNELDMRSNKAKGKEEGQKNCAIHQVYQSPLIMLTFLTTSYLLGFF